MKKLGLVLTTLFIYAALSSGSETAGQRLQKKTELAVTNITKSLTHEINGIVSASIYNSIFLKKYFPTADMNDVVDELREIADNSNNPELKYKAQIALMYIAYGDGLNIELTTEKENQDKLFKRIAQELQNKLLASN